jgi:hypothetical protein
MRLPFAIGAVVDGFASAFQTPLSGQMLPVPTRVPMGARCAVAMIMALSNLWTFEVIFD